MKVKNCKGCGQPIKASNWTCPECGYTEWASVFVGIILSFVCIGIATVMLSGTFRWVIGVVGVLFFAVSINGIYIGLKAPKIYKELSRDIPPDENELDSISLIEKNSLHKASRVPSQQEKRSLKEVYFGHYGRGYLTCLGCVSGCLIVLVIALVVTTEWSEPEAASCTEADRCGELEVINRTNGTVTVKLSGHASGEWEVSPGTTIIRVKEGKYDIVGSCGLLLRTTEEDVTIAGKRQITYSGDC